MLLARSRLTPYSLRSWARFNVARFEEFCPRALKARGRFRDKTGDGTVICVTSARGVTLNI